MNCSSAWTACALSLGGKVPLAQLDVDVGGHVHQVSGARHQVASFWAQGSAFRPRGDASIAWM